MRNFARSLLFLAIPVGVACTDGEHPQCNAIQYVPPVVTVVSASGAPIACDATFTLAYQPGSSAPLPGSAVTGFLCSSDAGLPVYGCPTGANAGAAAACVYLIDGIDLGNVEPYELTVSQTGFQSVTIDGFHAGEGGCVPAVAASSVTVTLEQTG
jgi:hypothetical protein